MATDAATADISQLPHLLHGEETKRSGDQAYWKTADREALKAAGVRYRASHRAAGGGRRAAGGGRQ